MKPELAEQNLQLIRTLMERSTIYRRALAPMLLLAGVAAISAATAGHLLRLDSPRAVIGLWSGTGLLVMIAATLLARRAAAKDREPFWSPPLRRVVQAMLPAVLAGVIGTVFAYRLDLHLSAVWVAVWSVLYGCALHAAGMFAPRTLRRAGLLFVAAGGCVLFVSDRYAGSPHLLMGAIFGGLHLAGGIYLLLTNKKA